MRRLTAREPQLSRKHRKTSDAGRAKRDGQALSKPQYVMFDNILHKINRLSGLYRQSSASIFFAELKIGRPEVRLLHVLGHYGPLASHEVVMVAAMDKAMVSRATRNLIGSGQVKQEKDSKDGRRSILSLTTKGRKDYEFVLRTTIRRHDKAIENLSPEGCRDLDNKLDLLIESAEEMLEASAGRVTPRRKVVD